MENNEKFVAIQLDSGDVETFETMDKAVAHAAKELKKAIKEEGCTDPWLICKIVKVVKPSSDVVVESIK